MKNEGGSSHSSPPSHHPPAHGRERSVGASPADTLFRAVFESSRDAIGISKAGIHVLVNPAYLALFGFPPGANLAGMPVLDLIAPENRAELEDRIAKRSRGETVPATYETKGRRTDGSVFDMEVSASLYRQGNDDLTIVILRDVSLRRRTERESAQRGATLQQIMDTASVAIFLVDKSGRITHANRRMAEMFGCSLEQVEGSEYVDLVHPSEREIGRGKMLALLASEIPSVDLERHYWRRDGSEFWGHLAGRRFRDADGREVGLIGVITNIDQRKKAELQLQENEIRLRTILDNVGAAIFIKDTAYRYSFVNPMVCETFGRAAEEILGRTDEAFLPPETAREVMASDRSVIEDGNTVAREEIATSIRGTAPKTYWTVKLPLRDGTGAITGLCGIATDITARKEAEEALRLSAAKFRRLYNETPVLLHSIDRNGRLVEVNDYWLATLGYERDEVIGRPVTDFYTESSRRYYHEEALPAFLRDGVVKDIAYQFVKKSGDVVDILLSATAERDASGAVVRSQAVIQDVTDRKRTEDLLRESEERFRNLAETLPLTIFEMDPRGQFTFVNRAAAEMFGYLPEEVRADVKLEHVLAPVERDRARAVVARRLAGEMGGTHEYQAQRKDGTIFPVAVTANPIVRDGTVVGVRGIVMDLAERKQLEEERLKAQKLESIGTLAGGIAHDFNNLLQGVFGYISMARKNLESGTKSRDLLERAEQALHQSVHLTSQLLTFSKGGKPVRTVLALPPLIERAANFALSGSATTYTLSCDDDLPTVEADEGQLGQVFQNLVLNAEQAMAPGGTVKIVAKDVGGYVAISVTDQGAGIRPEHLPRIFDPYFTTKKNGSGLGLATSYSIVRNHEGELTVASEPGKGATFTVRLPASGANVAAAPTLAGTAAAEAWRVLVMEDEAIVREVVGDVLTALGHEAEFAVNGEQAVARYREAGDQGKPFDMVILDLTIRGGMGGLETLQELLKIDPEVKAVVSSGYSDDSGLAEYRGRGFKAFLKKPYTVDNLRETLEALMR